MAIEQLGVAGLTNELKQTYLRGMLMRAVPRFVYASYGKKAVVPRRGGKSVEWRRLETIGATTTALTEGTPPTATQITVSNVQATLDQYGQYTNLSDLVNTQTFDPIVAELTEAFGETLGDSIDQVVRNVVVAGTNVQYASTAGSRGGVGSGMYLTYAEIREAVNTLERNNAKRFPDGAYKAIYHPDTKRDMFADSDILATFQNAGPRSGSNPIMQAEIGRFYGVDFIETTNARVFSSAGKSGADVYATMICGQEAYGTVDFEADQLSSMDIIVKPLGSAGTSDPLNQVSSVGWKAAVAAAILNQNFLVRIEHTTSRKNAA